MYPLYLLQIDETKFFHIIAYGSASLYTFTVNFTFYAFAKIKIAEGLIT